MTNTPHTEPTLQDLATNMQNLSANVQELSIKLDKTAATNDQLKTELDRSLADNDRFKTKFDRFNDHFSNSRKAMQWVVQLAFTLIASATLTVIITAIVRK
ncbi:hypothetical protein [Leptodesmis sp.]|uniref:hypothetical protein n=1 Tax=Leptodesmis sp. TaxID=3100501 RepID=UPI004053530E